MGGVSIISGTLFTECVGNHFRPQNNHAHYYHILFSLITQNPNYSHSKPKI